MNQQLPNQFHRNQEPHNKTANNPLTDQQLPKPSIFGAFNTSNTSQPPPPMEPLKRQEGFVSRLYSMLETPEFHNIVQWSESEGKPTFVILDAAIFQERVLVSEFRNVNFSSFVRQLNKYDFHKVKFKSPKSKIWEFFHPLFKPENINNPGLIKRKQLPQRKNKPEEPIQPVSNESDEVMKQIAELNNRISRLEQHNIQLFNVVNMQQDLIERLTKAVELPDIKMPVLDEGKGKEQVLIAIDNDQAREILTKILESLNYMVESLDNGTDLVNKAESTTYSFLLVDNILKYLDGVSAIEVIRQSNSVTPIVLLMDYSPTEPPETYMDRGASAVLYRPFTQTDLVNTISQIR